MITAGYEALRTLDRTRTLELSLDSQTSRAVARSTIAISVTRGIANYLPPHLDPLFRRRLRYASPRLALEQSGAFPGWSAPLTKVEVVLRMLPHPQAAVAVIDLRRSGSRLWLKQAAGCDDAPVIRIGDAVILAPDARAGSELGAGPRSSTLAFLAISSKRPRAEEAMSVGIDALCSICDGVKVASTSQVIEPAVATTAVRIPGGSRSLLA